jgi:hypothetical protein
MWKRFLVVLAAAMLVLTVGACKKKEETPIPQTVPGPGIVMPVGETQIIVPESVKEKWSAVTITIEDKMTRKTSDVTINLGDEYTVPGSNLKIKVGEFLPDFKMRGNIITSSSDEPNNPAVRVTVFEDEKEIFRGWLYSKFPAIHPFQHEKYGLLLKEGIKKG